MKDLRPRRGGPTTPNLRLKQAYLPANSSTWLRSIMGRAPVSRINPAYDGSDHLHLNPAGYEAMANAVNLAELKGRP